MRRGSEMADVFVLPERMGFAGLPGFAWPSVAPRMVSFGLAVLASAAAAWTICALSERPTPPVPPAHQAAQASAGDQHIKEVVGAALDVAKMWTEERALLFAATYPGLRGISAKAWSPAGGVSTLLATRFPSAGNVLLTAEAQTEVPLPRLAPAVHPKNIKRPVVARKPPAQQKPQVASLPTQAPEPGFIEFFRKLFRTSDDVARETLAANPKTAIYDIEKRVIYLPSGDKLEAHSGYGRWLDDPTSVNRKDQGVTPPNVYAVSFREKLFHGVSALRLTPVGAGNMYGRDGILAHSYMLGEDGQSNGCVSIKNYQKFLQAYESGDFNQLIVVRSVNDAAAPSRVASAQFGSL
jgi:Tlde1 domain